MASEALTQVIDQNPLTLSRPNVGKTMLGLLKGYGKYLHEAHVILTEELKSFSSKTVFNEWEDKILLFRFFDENIEQLKKDKYSLISSSLLMNWICGRILNRLSENADLIDAEIWFQKLSNKECISSNISDNAHELILYSLRKIDTSFTLAVLPYLSEVFETGSETSEEKGSGRTKKKANGIYYTPTDVIDFIIERSFLNRSDPESTIENLTWYDPALGTGSFLLSVLRKYSLLGSCPLDEYSCQNLFGTDISSHALQSAAYWKIHAN